MNAVLTKIFPALFAVLALACVPQKYLAEERAEKKKCIEARDSLLAANEKLTVANAELEAKVELLDKEIDRIKNSGKTNVEELKILQGRYNQLKQQLEELKETHEALVSGSDQETRELMKQLEENQERLYQKEEKLNQLSLKLDAEKEELASLKHELEERNKKLIELQNMIARKDSLTDALKNKVISALTGFEGKGLTIKKKNGKIYVSLDQKLLFGSGSTKVDAKGVEALIKLAEVLETNKDINITIEGHTDDVPVSPGSVYKDNWGLSVSRATAIIRILLDNSSIDPNRLTAAGRGEHDPVDANDSPEARQKNRRTEIILTPNLDEVFDILD